MTVELRLEGYANKTLELAADAGDTRVTLEALPKKPAQTAAPKATKKPSPAATTATKPAKKPTTAPEVIDPWN
ncbi:hypothetical protein D3C83_171320 [compost metagenome]